MRHERDCFPMLPEDMDGLVGAYSANTVVQPAGMAPVRGFEALRSAVAEWIEAAPVKSLAYTTEDLSVFGDTAFHVASSFASNAS
jgi:ketosteroid isomerase-like protein